MAKRACIGPGAGQRCPTGAITDQPRCSACSRVKDRERGTSAERGYGAAHRRLSERERAAAVGSTCHLCGRVMAAGQRLALDHTPDRTGYRGVVHESCNNRDGAIRGNQMRT